jgi:hypothetical protein
MSGNTITPHDPAEPGELDRAELQRLADRILAAQKVVPSSKKEAL